MNSKRLPGKMLKVIGVKNLISHIPKNRMMKTEDLFGVIELLCSEKNNFINGSTIIIDGGYSSW